MNDRFFIDTNILAYAFLSRETERRIAARKLVASLSVSKTGMISTQSVKEFANIAIKKFKYEKTDVAIMVDSLVENFPVHTNTIMTIKTALRISISTQFSFYDSLILAAAIESDCSVLYSEDLNNGQIVDGVKIVNPFV